MNSSASEGPLSSLDSQELSERRIYRRQTRGGCETVKKVLLLCLLAGSATATFGENRTFVRDYAYTASEDDSRNSSRSKAIEQVKVLLLEEIGVYVESWVQLEQTETNEQMSSFFQQEINNVTAGITETVIVDESWDGYSYQIKAQITLDTDDVLRRINEALEARASSEEVERLRQLLSASETATGAQQEKIEELREQIAQKEQGLASLQQQLSDAKVRLRTLDVEQEATNKQVQRILTEIVNKTESARENIHLGMKRQEVERVAGSPRAEHRRYLNYGRVWVIFNDDLVQCVVEGIELKHSGFCTHYRNYSPDLIIKGGE
jgi:hypothetical protein